MGHLEAVVCCEEVLTECWRVLDQALGRLLLTNALRLYRESWIFEMVDRAARDRNQDVAR